MVVGKKIFINNKDFIFKCFSTNEVYLFFQQLESPKEGLNTPIFPLERDEFFQLRISPNERWIDFFYKDSPYPFYNSICSRWSDKAEFFFRLVEKK
jgi:hypothetical protein